MSAFAYDYFLVWHRVLVIRASCDVPFLNTNRRFVRQILRESSERRHIGKHQVRCEFLLSGSHLRKFTIGLLIALFSLITVADAEAKLVSQPVPFMRQHIIRVVNGHPTGRRLKTFVLNPFVARILPIQIPGER